jgi:hypothetical protein
MVKEQLTNERLKGLFKSNFELTRYAIHLGKYYLRAGREVELDSLLEEIRRNPNEDYLRQLQEIDEEESEAEVE